MSSLLKEAIVDAKALREAALQNAEAEIINKYSGEVKQTLNKLLEQDELGLEDDLGGALGDMPAPTDDPAEMNAAEDAEDVVEDVPLASTDNFDSLHGIGLQGLPNEGDEVEVRVNLETLEEAIASLESEISESHEYNFDEDVLVDILSEDEEEDEKNDEREAAAEEAEAETDEDEDLNETADTDMSDPNLFEELVDELVEKLTVDMGAELPGWAGTPDFKQKYQIEKELAHRRSSDVEPELEITKKAQEELVFENKQLKEELLKYKQATDELREGLQDVNLSNARLLYTNRVLRNTSLNERQKETIVEAISSAGSVTEARTIFDTLQSTVQSTPRRGPQSLSEAINRRSGSTVIRASRQEKPSSDPFQDRMMKLAGIK